MGNKLGKVRYADDITYSFFRQRRRFTVISFKSAVSMDWILIKI